MAENHRKKNQWFSVIKNGSSLKVGEERNPGRITIVFVRFYCLVFEGKCCVEKRRRCESMVEEKFNLTLKAS
jgi:hypothetical protein